MIKSNEEHLQECIKRLKAVSQKVGKFNQLEKKFSNRFTMLFLIDVGSIGHMKAGFDNHLNHQRPHIHIETKVGRISIAIDNGEILHNRYPKLKERNLNEIKKWVLQRKECLKLIYTNIQNCKSGKDFEPLINAMNKFF